MGVTGFGGDDGVGKEEAPSVVVCYVNRGGDSGVEDGAETIVEPPTLRHVGGVLECDSEGVAFRSVVATICDGEDEDRWGWCVSG